MRQVISVSLSPASSPGTSSGLKWRNLRRKVGVLKFSSSQTSRSLISMGNSCGEKERGLVGVTLYNCDHIFRQEEEFCIASLARWNAQLKGLVELERRSRNMRQEVRVLSGRQEIFQSTMEVKLGLQSRATERYHYQNFEEI